MKIAIIDTLGAHGGSFHYYTFGQAIGLIKSGVDVSVYTNKKTQDPNIKGLNFFQTYNNLFVGNSKFLNGYRWIFGTIKSVLHAKFNRISIFHFHIFHTDMLVLFNLLFVKLLLGKIVLTIHDVNSFSSRSENSIFNKLVYKLGNVILTHNRFSLNELNKINIVESIFIIPHGNYLPFISKTHTQKKAKEYFKISQNKKVLLFFGMIKKVKGLEILLKAFKNVVKKNNDIVLIIAGKVWKNDFSLYQSIIDKNNLNEYCIIHNRFIAQEKVSLYYNVADLVVLPYKKIYQSGVMLMAMSYDVPVLASDLPPIKEMIDDEVNGFLFASEDTDALSNKLNDILLKPKLLESVKINANKLIKQKFCWNTIGAQTKLAYESIQ